MIAIIQGPGGARMAFDSGRDIGAPLRSATFAPAARSFSSSAPAMAPSGVSFRVDLSAFSAVLQRVYEQGKRSANECVLYGMIKMLTSARAGTKKGQKNRKIETVAAVVETRSSSGVFADEDTLADSEENAGKQFYSVWRQGASEAKRMYFPPRGKKGDAAAAANRAQFIARYRPIERVGLAKKSWGWAMQRATKTMGMMGGGTDTLPGTGYRADPIRAEKIPMGIEIGNKLWWITKIAPGIEQSMVNNAMKQLEAQLEGKWAAGIRKAGAA
jgi:hypothetical protein